VNLDQGVVLAAVAAMGGMAGALWKISGQLTNVQASLTNLNTNMLLMIQQITLEARRSRDDVIDAVRERTPNPHDTP
jgi:hypothetical protein